MEGYALFSWGANSYGQLGLGHTKDQLLPSKVLLDGSQASSLKQISGGGGHTVLLKTDGTLLVFGSNKNGQCGVPPSSATVACSPDLLVPQPLPHQPWRVTKVACGWNHTLALTEGGHVIVWGCNAFGQLGLPSIEKHSLIPTQLPIEGFCDDRVVDVSAGLRHSLAVTENGCLFSWGDGRKGQLGLGVKELDIQKRPLCISSPVQIACTRVCAGAHHSTAITVDKSLLCWGLNQHGQCCVSTMVAELQSHREHLKLNAAGHITNVCAPVKVTGITAALAEVHCGWSHTLVVTEAERKIFGWGRADYGQLGQPPGQGILQDRSHSNQPGQGILQDKSHSNQPGQGILQDQSHDQEDKSHDQGIVQDKHPRQEIPSEMQAWTAFPMEIGHLKQVKQVACGSEHTVVITTSGGVAAFGWNEHGMCGTGREENVGTATKVSGLPHNIEGGGILVGAGAGHSLALVQLPPP